MKICSSRQLLGNIAYTASTCQFFVSDLDFFRVLICKANLSVVIFSDELESFPADLEEDVVKFVDRRASAHHLENLPQSDWSHINI